MWIPRTESLAGGRVIRTQVKQDDSPLPYSAALSLLQNDADFRSFFLALLADAPFAAFRWETPPVSDATIDRQFEFVMIDSPGLAKIPDSAAFATHFTAAPQKQVVSFRNLGNDATLIVPAPLGPATAYGHIAAFVREAPDDQKHALWRVVGEEMLKHIRPTPIWLSTAGAGVPWLHVRMDATPKYYGYRPYRDLG
jgi:hypothetical protein